MPNGFPAFRYDPTTAPRYIVRTTKDKASGSTDSSSEQDLETSKQSAKQSEYQHPIERGMELHFAMGRIGGAKYGIDPPKKLHSKTKEAFKRLLC